MITNDDDDDDEGTQTKPAYGYLLPTQDFLARIPVLVTLDHPRL